VRDINPGPDSSEPRYLTAFNGNVFFRAYEPSTGWGLWKSDGTATGTVLVKDTQGGRPSNPTELTVVGNTLFFRGGYFLWKTDGTAAGTVIVREITSGGPRNPRYLTAIGSTLYFCAYEPGTGQELWRSDGTAAGTVLVKDINPGSGSSATGFLTAVGDTLFFRAGLPGTGAELWKSDGTAAGTVLVKDVNPGAGASSLKTSAWLDDSRLRRPRGDAQVASGRFRDFSESISTCNAEFSKAIGANGV